MFGKKKKSKTVKSVCETFTQDLQEIAQACHSKADECDNKADQLINQAKVQRQLANDSLVEAGSAEHAIANINKMFGVSE